MYRILVEATEHGQFVKRYLLSKPFCTRREADAFAATWDLPTLTHTVVTAEEATATMERRERANPSHTYLRTGRIWDLTTENCREYQRRPAAPVADVTALFAQVDITQEAHA
jgi:hypothetical protein